jgi:hypothetical protein
MGRRAGIAALICAGVAAAGCNGESEPEEGDAAGPRAVAQRFVAAVTRGHATAACKEFLPRSAEIWFRGPCVPRPSMPLPFEDNFANGEVQSVRGNDEEAEVAVKTRESGVTGLILRNTINGWKIFNLSEGSEVARQDKRAISALTALSIAIIGYLEDHGNSFAGAGARDLRKYYDAVPRGATVTSTRDSVTISVPSQSGNVFRLRQVLRGGLVDVVSQDCRVAGVGKCPADAEW